MLTRSLQLALVVLGALGFLLQSLCMGIPAGLSLCIGCKHGGWIVSAPCEHGGGPNCCEGEGEVEGPGDPMLPVAHGERDCGCIDIPLMSGTAMTASAPRIDSLTTHLFTAAAPVAILPPGMNVASGCTAIRPRAGPSSPPRLLAPSSRRTVLVL
jgi:hypothetical protein